MPKLKNLIGDLLGYGRCPVTNDTYWNANTVNVPYDRGWAVIISERALRDKTKEEIAKKVYEIGKRRLARGEKGYSVERIIREISDCSLSSKSA
jgi:hypothetical protein